MSARFELVEHRAATFALPEDTARSLAAASGPALSVVATRDVGVWELRPTSMVGTVVVPGLEVLIRPKLSMENLFALLDLGMPERSWRTEVFGFTSAPHVLPAFSAFFARTVDRLTSRGLLRSYRADADRVMALRGRIDIPEQLRRPATPSPIACRFDELTTDVPENRYLLGAIEHLLRLPGVPLATRAVLQHARSRFEDVVGLLPAPEAFDRIVYTRLNEHYRPALAMAAIIARSHTMRDEVGSVTASGFLLDMNTVFEDFVSARLRRGLRSALDVHDQTPRHLGEGKRVAIRPDLEFHRAGRPVYVGDVKYKLTASGAARTSDYYQLLAYATVLRLEEGILIYAQVDDDPPEHEIVVQGSGTRLVTYRLDLSGGPTDIHASVSRLAQFILDRSRAAACA